MMTPGAPDYLMPTTTFVVFPVEGAPTLVIDALFSVNTIDSWIDDLYLVGNISSSDLPASNIQPDSERVFLTLWTRQNITHNQ